MRAQVPLGLIYPTDSVRLLRKPWAAPLLSAYALHPRDSVVSRDLVRKAHMRGLAVNVWTVNDAQQASRLSELGVDGIITDDVPLVRSAAGI